jgi:hypothetical protein
LHLLLCDGATRNVVATFLQQDDKGQDPSIAFLFFVPVFSTTFQIVKIDCTTKLLINATATTPIFITIIMNPSRASFSLCSRASAEMEGLRRILIQNSDGNEPRIESNRLFGGGDIGPRSVKNEEISSLPRRTFGIKDVEVEVGGRAPIPKMEKLSLVPAERATLEKNNAAFDSCSSIVGGGFPLPRLHKDILSPYSERSDGGASTGTASYLNLALKLAKKGCQNSTTLLKIENERRTPKLSSFPMPTLKKPKRNGKHPKPYSLKSYERLWVSIKTTTASDDDSLFVRREVFFRRVQKGRRS